MATKRFGPTQGAGTVIEEVDGEKSIEPGALGWCGYAGVLEKGPVGELIVAKTSKTFKKICGSRIDDDILPDVCEDFYRVAAGAGGLLLVRVTDGNEVQAELNLYTRKVLAGTSRSWRRRIPSVCRPRLVTLSMCPLV